ncbi:hypothetical protein MBIO_0690 [Mycoplasmopsis fermentans PG18]|uniref:Phosphatidate cytidylyltransferase n=2 Tax=Mycoplasmopsis fermentans TaxID=2115 RepID=C4XFN3_MYCFP|nr:hypothetical protein MBIO_0690 [Mycoplasmopsis fermentans PG18]
MLKKCIIINMKFFKSRILPAFIFVVVLLSWMVPLAIFGKNHYEARIVSYIFTAIGIGILCYEYFKANHLKWYVIAIFIMLILPTVVLPVNNFTEFIFVSHPLEFHPSFIQEIAKEWFTPVVLLMISVAFIIIEYITRNNMSFEDRLVRGILMFISLYVIVNTSKLIQITIILDWRYTILLFVIPSTCDIFGFVGGTLAGKKWIKQSFAPNVSPKKTWEGFIFALIGGIGIGLALILGLNLFYGKLEAQISIAVLMPFFSILGDLYFSYVKRINAIKDYSKILISHGGILDRFDSVALGGLTFLLLFVIFI